MEFFNPLQRISVGSGVDVDAIGREAHQLGEVIGLGLRAADQAKVNIDLVPDVVQAQRDITRRKPALITASVLFLGGLAGLAAFKAKSVVDAGAFLDGMETEEADLRQSASKIIKLNKAEDDSVALLEAYEKAENDRLSYITIWNDLSEHCLSETVWLTDIEFRTNFNMDGDVKTDPVIDASFASGNYGDSAMNGGEEKTTADSVIIRGLHLDQKPEVLKILKNLRNSEVLTFDWNEKKISDDQVIQFIKAPDSDNRDYAAPFEFVIPLKNPIQLK